MGNISSWLSPVSSRIPGASKVIIDSAVRTIIREFCDRTLLYVRELTAINIVDGTSEYTLVAPTNCSIVGVERVEVNGVAIPATSMDLLNRSPESWRQYESNQPTAITVDAEKVLTFKETPTESVTGGLIVWASLKPTPTTDTIPDFVYDDWFEAILNGVIANILRMPNKPWTSLQAAEYFNSMYESYLTNAEGKKFTGKAKVSIRAQSPPFSVIG